MSEIILNKLYVDPKTAKMHLTLYYGTLTKDNSIVVIYRACEDQTITASSIPEFEQRFKLWKGGTTKR